MENCFKSYQQMFTWPLNDGEGHLTETQSTVLLLQIS